MCIPEHRLPLVVRLQELRRGGLPNQQHTCTSVTLGSNATKESTRIITGADGQLGGEKIRVLYDVLYDVLYASCDVLYDNITYYTAYYIPRIRIGQPCCKDTWYNGLPTCPGTCAWCGCEAPTIQVSVSRIECVPRTTKTTCPSSSSSCKERNAILSAAWVSSNREMLLCMGKDKAKAMAADECIHQDCFRSYRVFRASLHNIHQHRRRDGHNVPARRMLVVKCPPLSWSQALVHHQLYHYQAKTLQMRSC
eukprot:9109740-Pyramimonas_sp.AAC.1